MVYIKKSHNINNSINLEGTMKRSVFLIFSTILFSTSVVYAYPANNSTDGADIVQQIAQYPAYNIQVRPAPPPPRRDVDRRPAPPPPPRRDVDRRPAPPPPPRRDVDRRPAPPPPPRRDVDRRPAPPPPAPAYNIQVRPAPPPPPR